MQSTHLREHNLSAVLRALQTASSPTSRAGLATRTRLTKPTVSKLVEELVGAGLVEEGEPVAAGAGRPMVPLRPASGTLIAIGLEIAADHISCLGIDLTGAELARRTTYHRVAEGTAEDAQVALNSLYAGWAEEYHWTEDAASSTEEDLLMMNVEGETLESYYPGLADVAT